MKNDFTTETSPQKHPVRQFWEEVYDTLFPADALLSERMQRLRRYLFSFFVPLVLMMMVYCSIGAWPFIGPNSPLVLDMNGQYVYFFSNLRNIILGDNSLLYSWSRSLGGEFLGMYAYYLASPISWLVLLFPADMITEAIWLMLVLKTGICGLTMTFFLDKVYPSHTLSTVLFSTLYAFCAYNLAYMSNIMWMDGVMLLPLLILGLEQLLSRRKYKLYTIVLSLIILSNYYIGFMICIFVVIYFIYYHISHERSDGLYAASGWHCRLRSLLYVGIFSIIAVAMSAVIILPAYYSLQLGKMDYGNVAHTQLSLQNLTDMISKLFYGHFDTISPSGSPFVYCGILTLLTFPLFFVSNKIKVREKIGGAFILVILVVSMVIPQVDMLWHGGQAPNWMNFRYSFIFSFMLILFSYRGFALINQIPMKLLVGIGGILMFCSGIISLLNYGERYDYVQIFHWDYNRFVFIANVLIIVVLLIILYFYRKNVFWPSMIEDNETVNEEKKKRGSIICLVVCVLTEAYSAGVLQNTTLAMDVGYASRASYVDFIHTTQPAVDYIYQHDDGFYRMEKTFFRMVNDNMSLDMRGISGSTSTMNMKTLTFLQRLGYSSSSYISWYYGGNPVNDSLLGIKYIIGDDGSKEQQLLSEFYNLIYEDEENNRYVFENPYSSGIAYAVHQNVLQIDSTAYGNSFDYLNAILSAMSGQEHEIFSPIHTNVADNTYKREYPIDVHNECEHDEHQHHIDEDGIQHQPTYVCHGNGETLYMCLQTHGSGNFSVYVNGEEIEVNVPLDCSASITPLGKLIDGEMYEIVVYSEYGEFILDHNQPYFYTFDLSEFQKTIQTVQSNQLSIDPGYTEDRIEGTITISEEYPILFTSIPYDKNWRIYVDGQQIQSYMIETTVESGVEKIPALDAVIAAELSPGEHKIVMEYRSTELMIGAAVSLAGLMVFATIIYIQKLKVKGVSKEG